MLHNLGLLSSPLKCVSLQRNYGKTELEFANKVKAVYSELNMDQVYKNFASSKHLKILSKIEKHASEGKLPNELFLEFVNRVYLPQIQTSCL